MTGVQTCALPIYPQALIASRDNAERNAVSERLQLFNPEEAPELQADVVVANILASALIALRPRLAALAAPSAPIALSGILLGQEDEVIAAYQKDFDMLSVAVQEDWVRISGLRSAR